jgi:L,D-transpeptidase ErfK/SrfK
MFSRRSCLRFAVQAALTCGFSVTAAAEASKLQSDFLGVDTFYETSPSDTLLDVARSFDLGYVEVVAANPGVDPWLPKAGTRLHLPTAHILPPGLRRGLVVNIGAMRIYAFLPGRAPLTFPIGTGVDIDMTPIGITRVAEKRVHPTWYPPASIRAEEPDLPESVPPGPDNPLGDYQLVLGWRNYGIHGTNKPFGVGRHVSHGCIRLYPEDIATLFPLVPVGTPVTVIDQRALFGWFGAQLFLQLYPDHAAVDDLEINRPVAPAPVPDFDINALAMDAAGQEWQRLNWQAIDSVIAARSTIAVQITR